MRKVVKVNRRRTMVVVVAFYLVATVVARRTLVRCREGHLFRTIWVPGLSIKAIRLGWYRAQFCPVGRHWTVVKPVKDGEVDDGITTLRLVPDDISLP